MAFGKFKDFLNRTLYEEGGESKTPQLTPEEIENYETSMAASNDEANIVEMAKKIIADSQVASDNDEFPDISNVQSVLETAGTDASHDLICKILINFAHCNPEELEKDGVNRRQAINDAIEQTRQQAAALKAEKAAEEQSLVEAERAAETACSEAIAKANAESEKAIEEERARSAAVIAEIRRRTDEATETAKQEREATRETIAAQRAENEATLTRSANLVAETEKQGQVVINQINDWLGYLK